VASGLVLIGPDDVEHADAVADAREMRGWRRHHLARGDWIEEVSGCGLTRWWCWADSQPAPRLRWLFFYYYSLRFQFWISHLHLHFVL
jgi:hypothetical protein